MNHCYNENKDATDRLWYHYHGFTIGRPKATHCQTVEQLEALGIVGVYALDVPADTVAATTVTGISTD